MGKSIYQPFSAHFSALSMLSLADLCHVGGVDYVYHDDGSQDPDTLDYTSHRTASLSSEASALSCVSILSADELDRLLSDVRSLGDDTLQVSP